MRRVRRRGIRRCPLSLPAKLGGEKLGCGPVYLSPVNYRSARPQGCRKRPWLHGHDGEGSLRPRETKTLNGRSIGTRLLDWMLERGGSNDGCPGPALVSSRAQILRSRNSDPPSCARISAREAPIPDASPLCTAHSSTQRRPPAQRLHGWSSRSRARCPFSELDAMRSGIRSTAVSVLSETGRRGGSQSSRVSIGGRRRGITLPSMATQEAAIAGLVFSLNRSRMCFRRALCSSRHRHSRIGDRAPPCREAAGRFC